MTTDAANNAVRMAGLNDMFISAGGGHPLPYAREAATTTSCFFKNPPREMLRRNCWSLTSILIEMAYSAMPMLRGD